MFGGNCGFHRGLACTWVLAVLAALPPIAHAERPNIVWLVVDALRWDRVSAYDPAHRKLSPFLDSLARRSHVYWRAYAASSWTMPSVAAMFTSRYPLQLGVVNFRSRLDERETTVADALRAHGYATAGFTANPLLRSGNGYGQGFESWYAAPFDPRGRPFSKTRADFLLESLRAWLASQQHDGAARRPVFLFFHLMETHFPYAPPPAELEEILRDDGQAASTREAIAELWSGTGERWRAPDERARRAIVALYEAEVLAADRAVARIAGALAEHGILDRPVLIVTADHGEDLFDAEGLGHAKHLREVTVRVPLLISFPRQAERVDVHRVVSLLDLAPTVLSVANIPVPRSMQGRPLERLDGGAARLWAKLFPGLDRAMIELPRRPEAERAEPPGERAAWVEGNWKLVERGDGQEVLWQVDTETLAEKQAHDVATARKLRKNWNRLRSRVEQATAAPTVALEDAVKERLRALGYAE